MGAIDWVVVILAAFPILGTVASLMKFDDWWIRAFDFPRVQLVIMGIVPLCLIPFTFNPDSWLYYLLAGVLVVCLLYQVIRIWPYTPMAAKQVLPAKGRHSDREISFLMSNVLQTNQNSGALLRIVEAKQPDILLTLETNHWWEEQLSVLEEDYPYTVKVPLENLYGMHLYSRLELLDPEILFQIDPEIPSIRTHVRLRSGEKVLLFCVHPKPPSPTESYSSTDRDAELLLVGKRIQDHDEPVIVCGDLNDVAWSSTTSLFQRISGLLDPRKGRGFYSTFHAHHLWARWPLDHLFHSSDFTLIHLQRMPDIGSDHFPIFVALQLEKSAKAVQEKPQADTDDEQQAEEKIANGVNNEPYTILPTPDEPSGRAAFG